jgi:hypothetical protein
MVTLYRIKVEKEQAMPFDDRKKRLPVTMPANELPAEEPIGVLEPVAAAGCIYSTNYEHNAILCRSPEGR